MKVETLEYHWKGSDSSESPGYSLLLSFRDSFAILAHPYRVLGITDPVSELCFTEATPYFRGGWFVKKECIHAREWPQGDALILGKFFGDLWENSWAPSVHLFLTNANNDPWAAFDFINTHPGQLPPSTVAHLEIWHDANGLSLTAETEILDTFKVV